MAKKKQQQKQVPISLNTFYQGMNKDISKYAMKSDQYYDANNIRIVANSGKEGAAMVNVEGNDFLLKIPSSPKVIELKLNPLTDLTGLVWTLTINIVIGSIGTYSITINNTGGNPIRQLANTLVDFSAGAWSVNGVPLTAVPSSIPDGQDGFFHIYDSSSNRLILWGKPADADFTQYPQTGDDWSVNQIGGVSIISTVGGVNTSFVNLINLAPAQQALSVIGYTPLRDEIYLYTTNATDEPGGPGQIWKLFIEPSVDGAFGIRSYIECVYARNDCINFTKAHPIEAISRYEKKDIQGIYWTDNFNPPRKLNIASGEMMAVPCPFIDLAPKTGFSIPLLTDISLGGQLPAGVYQLAYRYKSGEGLTTDWSPLSNLVPVYDNPDSDPYCELEGTEFDMTTAKGKITGKRIEWTLNNLDTSFELIELAAVYRKDNIVGNAEIYLFAELINGTSTLVVNHTGSETLIPISMTDFLTGLGATFEKVKTLESKDNKLFFGNIENTTFYVDFDARAYRYNAAQQAILESQSDVTLTVDPAGGVGTILPANVPEQHDCINPFNDENLATNPNWFTNDQFVFQEDGITLGGQGPNITYNFIIEQDLGDTQMDSLDTDVVGFIDSSFFYNLSCTTYNTQPNVPCYLNPANFSAANALNTGTDNLGITGQTYPMNSTYDNQKSPYKWSLYGSYARGETYRFGIVFYNNKGQASFVNWIGDIKFPFNYSSGVGQPIGTFAVSTWVPDFTSPVMNIFLDNDPAGFTLHQWRPHGQVWLNQIGIEFTVDLSGLPPEVSSQLTGFSIVRCDRTESDKSRFGTALAHTLDRLRFNEDDWLELLNYNGTAMYSWGIPNNTSLLIPTVGFFTLPCGGWTLGYCDGANENSCPNWNSGAPTVQWCGYDVFKTRKTELLLYGPLGWRNSEADNTGNLNEGLEVTFPVVRGDYIKIDQVFYPHVNADMGLNASFWPDSGPLAGWIQHRANNWYKYYFGLTGVNGCAGGSQSTQIDYTNGVISNLNGMNPPNNRYTLSWGTWVPDGGYVEDTADDSLDFSFMNVTNPGSNWDYQMLPPAQGAAATAMTLSYTWISNRPRSIGSEVLLTVFDDQIKTWTGADHLMGNSANTVPGNNQVFISHMPSRSTFSYERYITPYGGPTYGARTYSEYISTGHFQPITAATNLLNPITNQVWGGDVQCQIYDFTQFEKNWGQTGFDNFDSIDATGLWSTDDIPSDAVWGVNRAVMVPLECHYRNILWRNGYYFSNKRNGSGGYPNDGTNLHDEYVLNRAYDAKNDVRNYFPLPLTFSFGDEFDTRIYYSETKINGESSDSWSMFLLNNYKDVEGVYGPINKLTRLHDTMYWFQDIGFGALSVNPTAVVQTQDGTSLQLGTVSAGAGAFIQDYKYISTQYGSSQQWAVTQSDSSIYFFDMKARKMFSYSSQGTSPLTDITGLHSYFTDNILGDALVEDNPILKKGVTSTYDIANHEAVFTFHDSGYLRKYEAVVLEEQFSGGVPNRLYTIFVRDTIIGCNPCFSANCEDYDLFGLFQNWAVVTGIMIDGIGPFSGVIIGKVGCPAFPIPSPNPNNLAAGDIAILIPEAVNSMPPGNQPDHIDFDDIPWPATSIQVDCGIGRKSFTIAYNELIKGFTSFYDFHPSIYINNGRFIVTPNTQDICIADPDVTGFKESDLYLHSYGKFGQFYDIIYPSTVTFISNMESAVTKVFDNVSFHMESIWDVGRGHHGDWKKTGLHSGLPTIDPIDIRNNTFDKIRFYTDYQITDYVDLIPGFNIKKKEREWQMAVPRNVMDENLVDADIFNVFNYDFNRLNKDRLRDKYLFIDLIFNNYNTEVGEPRNIKFVLHYFKTFFRPSYR